jgi:hypothetical protein
MLSFEFSKSMHNFTYNLTILQSYNLTIIQSYNHTNFARRIRARILLSLTEEIAADNVKYSRLLELIVEVTL